MKLGFYYHTPVFVKQNELFIPGYIGVFIDSLAKEVDQLILIMHEVEHSNDSSADYKLTAINLTFCSLGAIKPAWHRSFFPQYIFRKIASMIDCDCILVRAPTPLATNFQKFFKTIPVYLMIVGDYLEGAEHLKKSTLRDKIIYYYLKIYDKKFNEVIRNSKILVNSPALLNKYKKLTNNISIITTTTISNSDLHLIKKSIDPRRKIELLYTGRIDPAKGLFELIEALSILNDGLDVVLSIVGWEDSEEKQVERRLLNFAYQLGVSEKITFHGRKKVGKELFSFYERADIYVIPSYHEGFPRTIWEAMAKGLPVVASAVGGIPEYLIDQENCLLIEPKSVGPIVEKVKEYIFDSNKKQMIVNNAYEFVKSVTLENQTHKIINILRQYRNE